MQSTRRFGRRVTDGSVRAGVPLVLDMTVQRVENGACTPLTGAVLDVWHCDALGSYSDESALRTAGDSIRAVGGRVQPVDNLLHGRNRLLSLARMVRHRSFLVVTDSFVL